MIGKLRKKLILLYTCSTGLILTVVFLLILAINSQQLERSQKEAFRNSFVTVIQKVIMNNEVSQLWLAETETKNRLIIHIEDGGQALTYRGSWRVITDRSILVDRLKKVAEKDNIRTDICPVSVSEVQSEVYELKGDKGDRYYGQIYIVATENGYRSIIMLQYITNSLSTTLLQRLLILFLYLAGISALYAVSRWMVGKSLKPVEESKRRQSEFIASASHELKSPLAVIRANASALMVEPEQAEHFAKGIDKECARLAALIEDLLLLAAADARNWSMKKEMIDMDLLLIEIYDTFQPFYAGHNMQLRLEPQEELLPKLYGDPLRIKQILSVLLDNAASYSTEKDTIILRAYEKKNRLILEVEDHGAGIAPDMKKEIFERFYKGDKSRRDKSHFGLGLSIAKELAELHGGSISIRDTQGGGVTFIVSLPVHKE